MTRDYVCFYLNGTERKLGAEHAKMMLSDYLRYDQALTGTKVVCAEGDCGACSVLRFFPHTQTNPKENHQFTAINSCITPVASLDGASLITVDALKKDDQLHETQRAMMENHGSQCGFCTPGFVIALAGLTEKKIEQKENEITEADAKNALTGNLCRCTGYQDIINSAKDIDLKKTEYLYSRFYNKDQAKVLAGAFNSELKISTDDYLFYAPKTIEDACQFLNDHPQAKILASSTDLGVVHNKRRMKLNELLSLHLISDLYDMKVDEKYVTFGARVNFSDFRNVIKDIVPEFADYIDVFASPQIKNLATLVGNVCTASPIGDSPPPLLALESIIHLQSVEGKRSVPMSEFFLDYRKTSRKPNELVTAISFPRPTDKATIRFYKNANRKDLDISAVNLAVKVDWQDKKNGQIEKAVIAAGGIAATTIRLKETENKLNGQKITRQLLDQICTDVQKEFNPLSDLRASSDYRRLVVENLLRRSFFEMNGEAL
jgi:xanthine dehydrogenase small subunit